MDSLSPGKGDNFHSSTPKVVSEQKKASDNNVERCSRCE